MGEVLPVIVSVDTEEDNWFPVRSGLSVENVRELPRLAEFLARLGVRPTYFVSYQVASRRWAGEILRGISAGGAAEIGAHVHSWNTPPFVWQPPNVPTMLCNSPISAQAAKIRTVTETLASTTGAAPVSFRSGRYGLGPGTVVALKQNGYSADSSVTPFFSWTDTDHGPDFTAAPLNVYRLDGRGDVCSPAPWGALVEVPLSGGFTRFSPSQWPTFAKFLRRRLARWIRVGGLAAELRLLQKTMLTPESTTVRDMLALSRLLAGAGVSHLQVTFHSPSLSPGLTPFAPSRADVDLLLARLERYLEQLSKHASLTFKTVSEVAAAAAPERRPEPAAPPSISLGAPGTPPTVSVIIPAYNVKPYIGAAIDSVLDQTYRDFEVFVVDDGSTDGTYEVVQGYGNRVHLLRQPNRGVSAARNAGIQASRGRYVAFLDGDDTWEPDKLELQVRQLEADPELGLAYADYGAFEASRLLSHNVPKARGQPRPSGNILRELFLDCIVSTPTVVIRREALDEVGLFNETFRKAQDYDMWLRVAARYKCGHLARVVAWVGRRPGSQTTTYTPGVEDWQYRLLTDALAREGAVLRRQLSRHVINRRLALGFFQRGYDAFWRGDFRTASAAYRRGLKTDALRPRAVVYLLLAGVRPLAARLVRRRRALDGALDRFLSLSEAPEGMSRDTTDPRRSLSGGGGATE